MPYATSISQRLSLLGKPDKKEWWERYLKGAIAFYGVPMAEIRSAVHAVQKEERLTPTALKEAAMGLIRMPVAEEKLAGILVLQELVLPAGALAVDDDLDALGALFDEGHIADWNTCDWLCVRVMGPLAASGGEPAARAIALWVEAPALWRRRAGTVSFVTLATDGDGFFPGFVDMLLHACHRLVHDSERFAQTAVGWLLRDLSVPEPDRVHDFLERHRDEMSREAVRMGAARLSDEKRTQLGLAGPRRRR